MSTAVDQFVLEHLETELVSPETILRASIGVLPDTLVARAGWLSYRLAGDVREGAQRGIRLRLGDANEQARLSLALKLIGASDQPARDRAAAFVELVSWFPMPAPAALVEQALAFVDSLEDETLRAQALWALAPHLPEPAKDDVFGKVRVLTRTRRYRVAMENLRDQGYSALAFLPGFGPFEVALHKFIEALSESDRLKLFSRALDIAEQRLAPPPPETPPPAPELGGLEGAIVQPPKQRVVNTGFAPARLPGDGLERSASLMPGLEYLFWVEIGEQLPTSIEVRPTALPIELLPAEARLHVVVFGFDGELELDTGADIGEIQLTADGLARVIRQPIADAATSLISDRLDRRLYFPIRAPQKDGEFRLRCNIYCQQVVVQSRLVTAPVRAMPVQEFPPMQSVVDYTLTESLNLRDVAALRPHGFSLLINGSEDGTHEFRFFGTDGAQPVKRDISLSAPTVKAWIKEGRKRLRKVSWNDVEEWDPTKANSFRYDKATVALSGLGAPARDAALKQLTSDLARLAVGGYRIYSKLSQALGVSQDPDMERMFRRAGAVQIAIRMIDRLVFPAALVYDYHWDTNAFEIDSTPYQLCPQFREAILSGAALETCGCFGDSCPVRIKGDALKSGGLLADLGPLICPSGFWGYRHALGMPLTLTPSGDPKNTPADAPGFILFSDTPHVAAGISTDPDLKGFGPHAKELRKRAPAIDWRSAQQTRGDVLKMLRSIDVQLIYFYCHGGVLGEDTPFLSVGHDEAPITPDNISGVQWARSNPLVFINGCHTTALDPATALDFVSTFIDAKAGGVVGTEITISEVLACAFAEECLSRFLVPDGASGDTLTIGQAVRSARLALLKMGNPLGLVYIPFALESLRLKHKAA